MQNAENDLDSILKKGIYYCVLPLVKFSIRHGLPFQIFLEICKNAFVHAAEIELKKNNIKVNPTRVSIKTGLTRKESTRLMQGIPVKRNHSSVPAKVVDRWLDDWNFRTKAGKPRILKFKGMDSQFYDLVRSVSSDISVRSVLDYLLEANIVNITPTGLSLKVAGNITRKLSDESFELLSSDIHDLMYAFEENTTKDLNTPNLHATTEATEINPEHFPEIKEWILVEGTKFHRKLRTFLARYDEPSMSKIEGDQPKGRVSVSTFSICSIQEEKE